MKSISTIIWGAFVLLATVACEESETADPIMAALGGQAAEEEREPTTVGNSHGGSQTETVDHGGSHGPVAGEPITLIFGIPDAQAAGGGRARAGQEGGAPGAAGAQRSGGLRETPRGGPGEQPRDP